MGGKEEEVIKVEAEIETDEVETDKVEEEVKPKANAVNIDNLNAKQKERLKRTGKLKIGPNSKCPCGSGKKAKVCCLPKIKNPNGMITIDQ